MIQCETATPGPCSTIHYSQDQKRLFTGLHSGRVVIWDVSRMPVQQLSSIPDGVDVLMSSRMCALDYDSTSSTLFAGTSEGFSLWSITVSGRGAWGKCTGQIRGLTIAPTAVAWAASSRELLAGFTNGAVIIFDADSGDASYALQAHNDEVTAIVWLDAPRRLLTASKDKTMKIWDFPSFSRIGSLDDMVAGVSTPVHVSSSSSSRPKPSGGGSAGIGGLDPLRGGYSNGSSQVRPPTSSSF